MKGRKRKGIEKQGEEGHDREDTEKNVHKKERGTTSDTFRHIAPTLCQACIKLVPQSAVAHSLDSLCVALQGEKRQLKGSETKGRVKQQEAPRTTKSRPERGQ